MSKTSVRVLGILCILLSGPLVLASYSPYFIMVAPYLQNITILTGFSLFPIGGWMLLTPIEEPDEEEESAHTH